MLNRSQTMFSESRMARVIVVSINKTYGSGFGRTVLLTYMLKADIMPGDKPSAVLGCRNRISFLVSILPTEFTARKGEEVGPPSVAPGDPAFHY